MEHPWWEWLCGPHLPAYRRDRNAQFQPPADLSTPGTSRNDKYTGNERIVSSLDQIRVIVPLLDTGYGALCADTCTTARRRGGEGACSMFGIGLRPQWHVHAAQERGVEGGLKIARFTAGKQRHIMPMRLQVLHAVAGIVLLCRGMDGVQAARLPEGNVISQVELQALKNF